MKTGVWLAVVAVFFLARGSAAQPADTRLADAVQRQQWQEAEQLLTAGAGVNAAQADGATPLAWAAHWSRIDLARALIAAGAAVDAANDHGVTPLALACLNGSRAMVDLLLEAGADPNRSRATGETPLMTAAFAGAAPVVEALLARRADPNANGTRTRQTALMLAIAEGHADVARMLVAAGADVHARSAGGFTPLLFAARHGDRRSAEILLDAGAKVDDPAADGSTPLVVAIASGREETALLLLDRGASPHGDTKVGYTPLHAAVSKNAIGAAGALLARGADPDARLARAPGVVFGRSDGAGTDVRPPEAASADDAPRRAAGRDPLAGATPFLLAARLVNVPMMKRLVEGGADPAVTLPNGTTPLMLASGLTHVQGPRVRRGDVSQFYTNWNEDDSREAVAFLLGLGADVNVRNQAGQSALHAAAYMGGNTVAQLLAARGAALDVQDAQGQTPYRIAEGHLNIAGQGVTEWPETAALLRRLGANVTLGVDGRTMLRQYGNGLDDAVATRPR